MKLGTLSFVGALILSVGLVNCTEDDKDGGSGGTAGTGANGGTAGTGANGGTAGSGGSTAGTGGSTAGTGGSTAGTGGSTGGTGGSTGGTGGTTGDCTDGGTGTCQQCVQAAQSGCCMAEFAACGANPSCVALNTCLDGCGEDESCIDGCISSNPGGIDNLFDILDCMLGPDDGSHPGACGVACSEP